MDALTFLLANAGAAVMPSDTSSPTAAASKTRLLRLNRVHPPLVDARCPNGDVGQRDAKTLGKPSAPFQRNIIRYTGQSFKGYMKLLANNIKRMYTMFIMTTVRIDLRALALLP